MDFTQFLDSPKLRKQVVPIVDIGDVILTEISSDEAYKLKAEAENLTGEGLEKNHDHMRWWACRMLKGSPPTKAEVNKFKQGYALGVSVEIYQKGQVYNGVAPASNEEIEKNLNSIQS